MPIDWPEPDSDVEDWIFAASALIFVDPSKSERAQQTCNFGLVFVDQPKATFEQL
jgi:hypothetical protein